MDSLAEHRQIIQGTLKVASILITVLVSIASAIIGAVVGSYLQRRWTPDLSKELAIVRQEVERLRQRLETSENERSAQNVEDQKWATKFESAASQVARIGPHLFVPSFDGTSGQTNLYGVIFPDPDIRGRIQTFLVEPNSSYTQFTMRLQTAEHLRRPVIQSVVDEALQCLEAFRKKHPELAATYLKSPSM